MLDMWPAWPASTHPDKTEPAVKHGTFYKVLLTLDINLKETYKIIIYIFIDRYKVCDI